jgi:hypothetical protein
MVPSQYNNPLERFKNIHSGKSAIIFATGPTITSYSSFDDSEGAIKIGLNRIYEYPDILETLDYYYFGSQYYTDEKHRNNIEDVCFKFNFTKFASAYEEGRSHAQIGRGNISPSDAEKIGAIPFENNLSHFTNDIANYSTLGHSIVFPPLQHILYMGVSQIYLVGCDGAFSDSTAANHGNAHLLHWWRQFKEFKDAFYGDVRIISINPVSLKGWFDDKIIE